MHSSVAGVVASERREKSIRNKVDYDSETLSRLSSIVLQS